MRGTHRACCLHLQICKTQGHLWRFQKRSALDPNIDIEPFLPSASDWINLQDSLRPSGNCLTIPASEVSEKRMHASDVERGISQNPCASQPDSLCCRKESLPINTNASATTSAPLKLNIDLNNIYDDSQGGTQKLQNSGAFANPGAASSGCPLWISHDPHKCSSTRTSWNSGSTSSLSPSSSSGEAQVCVFCFLLVFTIVLICNLFSLHACLFGVVIFSI